MSTRDLVLLVVGVLALIAAWLTITPTPARPVATPAVAPSDSSVFHREFFREYVARDPEWSTELRLFADGKDSTGDQLTDVSVSRQLENVAFLRDGLATLHRYERTSQNPQQLLATDTLAWYLDDALRGERFMFHDYPVNQLFGVQNQFIAFMTDIHLIRNAEDAGDYTKRLHKVGKKFDQVLEGLKIRERMGVLPPRAIVDKVLAALRDFVAMGTKQNPLYTSFIAKLDALHPPLPEANHKAFELAAELEIHNT